MIICPLYAGKNVFVLGLGRSGLSAAKSLAAGGACVAAWDDDAKNRALAKADGIKIADGTSADWAKFAAIVLSPGIPHTLPAPHPIVATAKAAGIKIISDIYLLCHTMPDAKFIGITGTNGKSTTTALAAHIIGGANLPMQVGGNLGQAAMTLNMLPPGGHYVLELSSYQTEIMPDCRMHIAAFLNLTPDHLDRHGDMEGYRRAKNHIFDHQQSSDAAIIGVDDAHCEKTWRELCGKKAQQIIPISVGRKLNDGIYVLDGILRDATSGVDVEIMDLRALENLRGAHNWQNAAFAYAIAKRAGIDRNVIAAMVQSFPGLAHRMQKIAAIGNIRFINDSKATNPDSAAKALSSYQNIYWIAGGKPKSDDLDLCAPYFKNIRGVFLIGDAAKRFGQILSPHMHVTQSAILSQAVVDAFAMAQRDGHGDAVVLLSPACASFDQFRDFEHRGDEFRNYVNALPPL